jgi:hypothetical protein
MVISGEFSAPGPVRVEGVAVVGVLGGEGRHPDAFGVTHLLEQGIQIPVLDRAQRDNSHGHTSCHPRVRAEPNSSALGQPVWCVDRHLAGLKSAQVTASQASGQGGIWVPGQKAVR